MGKHGLSAAQMDEFIVTRKADSQRYSDRYRKVLVSECGQQPLIETVWSAGRRVF